MTDKRVEVITGRIQYLNDPQEGKKKGSIKLEDDTKISAWPNELLAFQVGEDISVKCEGSTFNGHFIWHLAKGQGAKAPAATTTAAAPAPSSPPPFEKGDGLATIRSRIAAACIMTAMQPEDAIVWMDWVLTGKTKAPKDEEVPFSNAA